MRILLPYPLPQGRAEKFSIRDTIYGPALPFMFNMMFLMIPYGAVIAYSSIFAQEKGLSAFLPYFYIFLVAGMLVSKLSTQKMIDAGHHRVLVYLSLAVLTPAPQRGVANATYMLSDDVGIGSLLMGFMQESIGLPLGFALTAIAYAIGGVVYLYYVDGYYRRFRKS